MPLIGSTEWLGAIHDDAGDWRGDDDDDDDGDWDDEESDPDCGLMEDGQCMQAGTEQCDFGCPLRHSERFVGSAAWRRKHEGGR
jgi:hypothetical protein